MDRRRADRLTIRQKIDITLRELAINERDVSTYDLSDMVNGPRVPDGTARSWREGLKKGSTLSTEHLSAAMLFETVRQAQVGDHP